MGYVHSPWHAIADMWLRNDIRVWDWAISLPVISIVVALNARNVRESWTLVAATVLLVFAVAFLYTLGRPTIVDVYVAAKAGGLFGLFALALQIRTRGGLERLLTVIVFSTFIPLSLIALDKTSTVRALTLDQYVYAFDEALSFNPAQHLFVLFENNHWFNISSTIIYDLILPPTLILYAIQTRWQDPTAASAILVFIVASVAGFICYVAFPVSGPLYFFGAGRYAAHPATFPFPQGIDFKASWRNAMPSLHFGLTLLMALNVPRQLRITRAAFFTFAVIIAIAALGKGEHYFTDMIAALPFVCAIQYLCRWIVDARANRLLTGFIRSAAVFISFLIFLVVIPPGFYKPGVVWILTTMIAAIFMYELRNLARNNRGLTCTESALPNDSR